ncbi:hypothetical protein MRX96_020385 [Rhipicephalus microplus]
MHVECESRGASIRATSATSSTCDPAPSVARTAQLLVTSRMLAMAAVCDRAGGPSGSRVGRRPAGFPAALSATRRPTCHLE